MQTADGNSAPHVGRTSLEQAQAWTRTTVGPHKFGKSDFKYFDCFSRLFLSVDWASVERALVESDVTALSAKWYCLVWSLIHDHSFICEILFKSKCRKKNKCKVKRHYGNNDFNQTNVFVFYIYIVPHRIQIRLFNLEYVLSRSTRYMYILLFCCQRSSYDHILDGYTDGFIKKQVGLIVKPSCSSVPRLGKATYNNTTGWINTFPTAQIPRHKKPIPRKRHQW